MKPARLWAEGPGWELWHGRAEAVLRDLDLRTMHAITDPPYTEEPKQTKRRREHQVTDPIRLVIEELVDYCRTAVIITGATASTRTVLPREPRRILAIQQNMGTAVPRDAWMYGLQLANVYGPPRDVGPYPSRAVFSLPPRSVARQPRPPDHPNALPVSLGAWLAGGLASETVIDPFCGGGGLIAGARAAGAGHVIGVDVAEEWLEFARAKLTAAPERLWRPLADHAESEPMWPADTRLCIHALSIEHCGKERYLYQSAVPIEEEAAP